MNRVDLPGKVEVLPGQPSLTVRREGARHPIVADVDIRVMVRGLGPIGDPVYELDSCGEGVEGERLADYIAFPGPTRELVQPCPDLRVVQQRHLILLEYAGSGREKLACPPRTGKYGPGADAAASLPFRYRAATFIGTF